MCAIYIQLLMNGVECSKKIYSVVPSIKMLVEFVSFLIIIIF